MLGRLGRVLRRSDAGPAATTIEGPVPGRDERLWLDEPGVEAAAVKRSENAVLRTHALELAALGATKIEGAIDPALCDRVRAEYETYCDQHTDEAAVFADESGHRTRLANFHLTSTAALAIGTDPDMMSLLDFLFGYRASIYSSLLFERGTQQSIHRDGPYFCTEPIGFFFGVWTALEDISPNAGPLVYLQGAHRIELDAPALAAHVHAENATRPDEPDVDPARVFNGRVAELAVEGGMSKVTPTMRKGDTLIWHPELPHGGTPIVDEHATRSSIVFHCAPEGVPVFGPDRFYSTDRSRDWDPIRYRWANGRAFLDLGRPSFERNDV